jgi:uncharacterized damage-inducible protein DinB
MIETLKEILLREIGKLEEEIKSFPDEQFLWKTSGEIKNSAGNLCLHVCGNLQHFIGAELGNTGYVRNRDAEFASKNISKEKLIEEIRAAKKAVSATLEKLSEADLQKTYPQSFIPKEVTTAYFLVHLLAHFDYHLGQINYLRRIL